ncbi:enolase C-terminal domain-like protein [Micromonospora sp. M12]
MIRDIEDAGLDVELVEQPVARWDLDGLAWVSDRVSVPILADEAVFGVRDLVEVIRRRAADLVNVKLAKCGGLHPARTLLDLATAHGLGTVVGSMMESQVGIGAAASLVAAYGTTAVADLDAAWWLAWSPVQGGIRYDGATVVLPNSPGLGILGLAEAKCRRAVDARWFLSYGLPGTADTIWGLTWSCNRAVWRSSGSRSRRCGPPRGRPPHRPPGPERRRRHPGLGLRHGHRPAGRRLRAEPTPARRTGPRQRAAPGRLGPGRRRRTASRQAGPTRLPGLAPRRPADHRRPDRRRRRRAPAGGGRHCHRAARRPERAGGPARRGRRHPPRPAGPRTTAGGRYAFRTTPHRSGCPTITWFRHRRRRRLRSRRSPWHSDC